MADILETICEDPSNIERCTEELRDRIESQEEKIVGQVEEVSEKIKETLDWRRYVHQYPYLALGAAAGLGLLAGTMIVPEPPTTMDKVADFVQETAGIRVGNFLRSGRQRTILSSLGGLALTMGMGLARNAIKQALIGRAKRFVASEPEPPLSGER
jgi:ElaB/YqjD/DUF883 family membrane-anchored ribosome-binding protein